MSGTPDPYTEGINHEVLAEPVSSRRLSEEQREGMEKSMRLARQAGFPSVLVWVSDLEDALHDLRVVERYAADLERRLGIPRFAALSEPEEPR